MAKTFLLIALLTAMIGGITYYFIQSQSQPVTPTSPSPSPSPSIQAIKVEESLKCQTSDECLVVHGPIPSSSPQVVGVQCTNKSYLSDCKNCKTSSDIITETKNEATCSCVQNRCQFELIATP